MATKIEKIAQIRKELKTRISPDGEVKNIGSVFFAYKMNACVLRDVVYYNSKEFGLPFEVLCMTSSYFVGTQEHAEALKEAYGGNTHATEYCNIVDEPRQLWVWEGPRRYEQCQADTKGEEVIPLDFEEIKDIIF